jgi:hypothetical protein
MVHHPCTKSGSDDVYMRFLETLDSLLNKLPKSEWIIGADINANIGQFDNKSAADFGLAIGPHGFPNRNPKEKAYSTYILHPSNEHLRPGESQWTRTWHVD